MKFNVGYWVLKPGVTAYHCKQIRQVKVSGDKRSVHLYGVSYGEDYRGLDGPSFEIDVTAPQEGILRLQAAHFIGSRQKMPEFDLKLSDLPMEVTRDADKVTIASGDLALVVTYRP